MQFAPQIISDCLQMFSCLVKFDKAKDQVVTLDETWNMSSLH